MRFKKNNFYIRTLYGIEEVSGYTFEYNGIDFGVRKENDYFWSVTHIDSGLCATKNRNSIIKTRKEAVKEIKKDIDEICAIIKDDKVRDMIDEFQELKSIIEKEIKKNSLTNIEA